jgi:hypothetical protein
LNFFDEYFKFVGESEAPNNYHRWCGLSTLSSIIGREVFLPFGHKPIYPNQYILLMGAPGTRKSSAISISKELLTKAGYTTFAKDRSSKERFFSDMVKKVDLDDIDLEALVLDSPSEVLISNGEFLDFIGQGDMDFLTALTNLWDNLPVYEHPKLHGKSVFIHKPTVNILGGATVKGLGMAIPPEALGTGILSRLLLIHAEPTDKKITFPEEVPEEASDQIVESLMKIRTDIKGRVGRTKEVETVLDKMYKKYPGLEDSRFSDYTSRRFTHLLKLTMLLTISRHSTTITVEDAMIANTILHAAEGKMSKALGEFGKSKYSDVSNTVMDALSGSHHPMTHTELWKLVSKDLSDIRDLNTIMKNLLTSEKAQVITLAGKQGYLPLHKTHKEWDKDLLLHDYLREGE